MQEMLKLYYTQRKSIMVTSVLIANCILECYNSEYPAPLYRNIRNCKTF